MYSSYSHKLCEGKMSLNWTQTLAVYTPLPLQPLKLRCYCLQRLLKEIALYAS